MLLIRVPAGAAMTFAAYLLLCTLFALGGIALPGTAWLAHHLMANLLTGWLTAAGVMTSLCILPVVFLPDSAEES